MKKTIFTIVATIMASILFLLPSLAENGLIDSDDVEIIDSGAAPQDNAGESKLSDEETYRLIQTIREVLKESASADAQTEAELFTPSPELEMDVNGGANCRIEIDPKEVSIYKGTSAEIKARVVSALTGAQDESAKLVWGSSNLSIATVKNGKVIASRAGEAMLNAD